MGHPRAARASPRAGGHHPRARTPDTRTCARSTSAPGRVLGLDLLADVGSVVLADPSEGMIEVARTKIEAEGIVDAHGHRLRLPGDRLPPVRPSTWWSRYWFCITWKTPDRSSGRSTRCWRRAGTSRSIDLDRGGWLLPRSRRRGHPPPWVRPWSAGALTAAGFEEASPSDIVYELEREGRGYPLMLLTARVPEV